MLMNRSIGSLLFEEGNGEPVIISQLRNILENGYGNVKDPQTGKRQKVDTFTASAIVKVYDALKGSELKDKFASLNLLKMQEIAFGFTSTGSGGVRESIKEETKEDPYSEDHLNKDRGILAKDYMHVIYDNIIRLADSECELGECVNDIVNDLELESSKKAEIKSYLEEVTEDSPMHEKISYEIKVIVNRVLAIAIGRKYQDGSEHDQRWEEL